MKKFPPVAKDKESGLPKKYVAGLSKSTAKARAAHWKKAAKLSDSDPRAYKPAPGDATAKTKPSKYTKRFHKMFGEQIGIVVEGAPEKIEGTNCANCIHWVKESEKPVDKSELNEYGGLKAPNEAYVEMSKHADLVTLPGKAVVKIKAYCNHEDIHDFVTERMCCAYWDGEGVKREYKGISPKMDESVELDETIVKVDGKFRLVSKKTGRNLGTYDTKAGAMKRERQVQYFKHMGEEKMADYKPKVGDHISTIKGGQNTGKVEKVEGGHVYFRSDYKRSTLGRGDDYYPIFKTHVSNVRLHEVALDEMDKSQPSSSRGAEGLALGKKANPVKRDEVKSGALKILQKQYKKVKEEVEQVDEANMRFDYEAAARPKSSDVKNFLNRDKNARAAAASKKYIRRMTKLGGLGPNQTKKDTEAHMKAHFEEVEQVDEARGYKIEPKESPVFKGSRANPMMRHFSVSVGNKEVGWLEHDKDDDTVRGSLHGKSVNISRHKGDTVADKFKSYINQMKEEAEQVDEGSKRMSAAVKLQRAFDREKTASDASRKRGEEVLAQARKEYDKKQVAKTNEEVEQFEGFLSFLRKKPVAKKKPAVSHKHMRAVFSTIERQTRVAKPQQTGPVIHRHTVAAYESVEQIDERNKANAEAKKKVLRQAGVNAAISGKVRFGGSALQMGREAAKKLPSKGLAKAYRELPRVAEQMTDNAAITKKTERERRIRDTRVIHHQNRHIHQAAMGTMEESAGKSLADKARKSGISLGTLRKVYNRGVAAWNSGHRPGTTPQQWGHARVNSYITKGKTYHTADKDLRRESVDVNEAFEREFGDK